MYPLRVNSPPDAAQRRKAQSLHIFGGNPSGARGDSKLGTGCSAGHQDIVVPANLCAQQQQDSRLREHRSVARLGKSFLAAYGSLDGFKWHGLLQIIYGFS